MLPLSALTRGRHRLWVNCGQSRTAAFDPYRSVALSLNASWCIPGRSGIDMYVFLLLRQERRIKGAQRYGNPIGIFTFGT